MDSILKRYHADLPLLEQARLGCISEREWLSELAIALLWEPDPDKQYYLRAAIMRACKAGDLPYQGRPPIKPGEPLVIWVDETSPFYECYYITRDDLRIWLERCGEWPLQPDILLSRWWVDVSSSIQAPRVRADALTDAITAALCVLREELGRDSTAHEVYDYLRLRDTTGTVLDENDRGLIWETSGGKCHTTSLKALAKRVNKLRRRR